MAKPNLKDLQTKGFVIFRKFLSKEELKVFVDDFNSATKENNLNFALIRTSDEVFNTISKKCDDVRHQIDKETELPYIDKYLASAYFATQLDINFPWHSDHEDFYLFQNHYNTLNFYIPIIKPELTETNLSIIPFDKLSEMSPELAGRVINGGAKALIADEKYNRTFLRDDYYGGEPTVYNFNINEISITPHLEAGDLLLLRGDILHHTQDVNTDRVALSARFHYSEDEIDIENLYKICPMKFRMMLNNPSFYLPILDYFIDESCPMTLVSNFENVTFRTYNPHQFVLSKDTQQHWELHYVDCDSKLHLLNISDILPIDQYLGLGSLGDILSNIKVTDPAEISKIDLMGIKKKLVPWLKRFENEYVCENQSPKRKYTVGGLIDLIKAKQN